MICIVPMGRLVARVVVVGVAAAMVVAARGGCGGGAASGADGPTATVPTLPPDPYAVPAVIDEAYVNRVLAALDQSNGDVVRMVFSTKTLSSDAIERLQALYVGDALNLQFQLFQTDIFGEFAGYKPNPGNVGTKVARLITVRPECIFAEVSRDYSNVSVDPDSRLEKQWVALVRADPTTSSGSYNSTPWLYSYSGFTKDFSAPEDPCAKLS